MRPFENKEEAYDWCIGDGQIISREEIGKDRIESNLQIAKEGIESGKDNITKKRWNSTYKDHYDALHLLVESYLIFDKVKSKNHQCLFTFICVKHAELELDWNFFDKIRTKRNGINYYGTTVNEKDWKEAELQFNLYIKLLKEKIEEKLV
ncbi:hypothetical protein J4444_03630 [Candidatus Woesearchaeota archaeon]|nr:hypothetical protein [Candidatus Woesearchaeota archaeon]